MAEAKDVSLRDGRFRTRMWVGGTGAPLLYLHGWDGLLEWPSWLDGLTSRFQVMAPQHPGYGTSTGVEDLESFLDLTVYYLDFMDSVGLRAPAILAHSLGAAIAAEIAALSPSSVSRLALLAPMGLWDDSHPVADIFAMTNTQRSRSQWHDPDAAAEKGYIPDPQTDDDKRTDMLERTRSLSAAARFLFPIPDRGLKKRIHRISCPTLLVVGESDKIVPASYGKLFRDQIKGAKIATIPEAGHQPQIEQSNQTLEALAGFLGS